MALLCHAMAFSITLQAFCRLLLVPRHRTGDERQGTSSSPSSRPLSCVGGLAEDSDEGEDPSEALCTLVWCWRMLDNMCSIDDSACGSAFKRK